LTIKQLKSIVTKIQKHKEKIAKERDALRITFGSLKDCLESFDEGVAGLNYAMDEIESAINSISEVV